MTCVLRATLVSENANSFFLFLERADGMRIGSRLLLSRAILVKTYECQVLLLANYVGMGTPRTCWLTWNRNGEKLAHCKKLLSKQAQTLSRNVIMNIHFLASVAHFVGILKFKKRNSPGIHQSFCLKFISQNKSKRDFEALFCVAN